MARIRTIKPEILEDEKVAALSDAGFRLFVAMIVLADDHGNLRADARWLEGQIWWARRDPPHLAAIRRELSEASLIEVYEVRGQTYAHIRSWEKHQRIDNAGKARVPKPSEGSPFSAETCGEIPRNSAGPRPPTTTTTTDPLAGKPADLSLALVHETPVIDPVAELAVAAVAEINRLSKRSFKASAESVRDLCASLVKAKYTATQVVAVIRSKSNWIGDATMHERFVPATLLAKKNFTRYFDELEARKPAAPTAPAAPRPPREEAEHPLMALMRESGDIDAA